MKFISFGMLVVALTFCGLSDKIKQISGGASGGTNTSGSKPAGGGSAEPAKPSSAQQAIIDAGTETVWDDQGLSWRLPEGWKRMDVKKESFNYQSPDNAFLLVNISVLPDAFPMETSLDAYHEQALQQLKNGKYADVKLVSIDGVPGVEFTEAPPEGKDDVRRHQWIGYRRYLGQAQQLNVMTSTRGSNFSRHTDDFTAILYSMRATQ